VPGKNQKMPNFFFFFLLSFLASASLAAAVSTGWVWSKTYTRAEGGRSK
jgi:hypothetical protein